MALSFDHAAKLISVPQPDAQPLLIQDLVNAIRTEEASERGIAYDQILDATGKEALGGGAYTGITAAMRSTWKISFAAGAYQATIDGGNLADALSRVQNTGSPQVLIKSSAAATVVNSSGGTAPSATQVANAVWTHAIEGGLTAEQVQRILLAIAAGDATGLESGNPVFKSQDGSKDRVVATYSSGTRTIDSKDVT